MSKFPNDYISRQQLIEYANNSRVGIDANDIARFPAADVRENVSAKWIDMDSDSERYDEIRCSNCKHSYTVDAYRWCDIGFIAGDLKYCPNCGADMKEEKDEKKIRGED